MQDATRVLAPLPRRLASLSYEALLLGAVLFFAALPLAMIEFALGLPHVRAAYQIYLAAVAGLYFVWQWLRGGQTLAMKTWRVRLVSRDGAPITLRQALLRYIAALLLFGVSFLWALFDREGQFLHDRLTGTRVVRSA
ncbi:MAG TPA: RDD family protein [Burkholderiales bacterium]|nr:RDD family protein [Burkholderiales bacterium]